MQAKADHAFSLFEAAYLRVPAATTDAPAKILSSLCDESHHHDDQKEEEELSIQRVYPYHRWFCDESWGTMLVIGGVKQLLSKGQNKTKQCIFAICQV